MNRLMKLSWLVLLASCGKSAGAEHFEKLAKHANPAIIAMRESVSVVLDPKSDPKALRKACLDAIEASGPLVTAGFKDRSAPNRTDTPTPLGVDEVLQSFSMQKDVMCREDEGDGSRDARCRKWCVSMFTDLVDAIARAHDAAAKENVQLELLRK